MFMTCYRFIVDVSKGCLSRQTFTMLRFEAIQTDRFSRLWKSFFANGKRASRRRSESSPVKGYERFNAVWKTTDPSEGARNHKLSKSDDCFCPSSSRIVCLNSNIVLVCIFTKVLPGVDQQFFRNSGPTCPQQSQLFSKPQAPDKLGTRPRSRSSWVCDSEFVTVNILVIVCGLIIHVI